MNRLVIGNLVHRPLRSLISAFALPHRMRALQALDIPHTFLVFPGEGHSLDKNPWHGYIKVREELKWLDKYDSK